MSNTQRWRIGADLPEGTRKHLLQRFPPKLPDVFCKAITYAYRVPESYVFPRAPAEVVVYGYHRFGDEHEALLVRVNGRFARPDGNRFFITLSVASGESPVRATEIDSDAVDLLDKEIRLPDITFGRFPLWKQVPNLRRAA